MVELIIGLMTAGGSAGFGSILKMIGSRMDSTNKSKELRAEARAKEKAGQDVRDIEFQKVLVGSDNYARTTRRILALIGMLTLSAISIFCTVFPELQLITFAKEAGEVSLLGIIKWQSSAKVIAISLGHIALVTSTVVYPMIVGFYFTPGGRK